MSRPWGGLSAHVKSGFSFHSPGELQRSTDPRGDKFMLSKELSGQGGSSELELWWVRTCSCADKESNLQDVLLTAGTCVSTIS